MPDSIWIYPELIEIWSLRFFWVSEFCTMLRLLLVVGFWPVCMLAVVALMNLVFEPTL